MAEDCIFCKIVAGEIPAEKVFEDDRVLAFKDINPAAPVHAVIIPKEHLPTINDVNEGNEALVGHVFTAAARIARELGVDQTGYRITANTNRDAGQLVFHVHFHFLAQRLFGWPPG